MKELETLTSSEAELVVKAPLLVCILIAGADGNIDRKEIRKAITLTTNKFRKSRPRLVEFYKDLSNDFEDKLKIVLQEFPHNVNERNHILSKQLTQLNTVFKKLDKTYVIEFYQSLKEIANEIARSSGGVLGIKSVGNEEKQFLELTMIKDPSK